VLLFLAAAAWALDCPFCRGATVRVPLEPTVHYLCRFCSGSVHVGPDGTMTATHREDGRRRSYPLLEGCLLASPVPGEPPPRLVEPRPAEEGRAVDPVTFGHPVGLPGHPVNLPAHPVERPAHPVGRPGPPVLPPSHPVSRPAPPVTRPAHPVTRPAHPVTRPAHPVTRPAPPVKRPAHPVTLPGQAVRLPSHPVRRPGHPILGPRPPERRSGVQLRVAPRRFSPPAARSSGARTYSAPRRYRSR
jgi:hypothetical protein